MYEGFAALVPKRLIDDINKQLLYNNIGMSPRKFTGFMLAFGLALALAASVFLDLYFWIPLPIAFAAVAIVFFFIVYTLLKMGSDARGKAVELVLPDALQLVASNMKSGLTTERALFVAGRPEFGPLQVELRNASKKISSGEKVETALAEISERINSRALCNTIWLISEGIKRGGQISDLLFQLSKDLKNEQAIQDEIKANISIYVMLILFASIFGSPLLFGVSATIVQVVAKQAAAAPVNAAGTAAQTGVGFGQGFVSGERSAIPTVDFISLFSIVTIAFSSFFAAITIGVISTGKETDGLRHAIPIIAASLLVYFFVKDFMHGAFSQIL